jgi:hypothetical protein
MIIHSGLILYIKKVVPLKVITLQDSKNLIERQYLKALQ